MEHTNAFNTLFLDRDGVINVHRPDDYVKSVNEFIFIDGVLEALEILSGLFKHIVIVTNQRGVGKGLMSDNDLEQIHQHMMHTITNHKGRIDRIYVSTATEKDHASRKPNIGMALQAKKDFPDIDFSNSWLVGDSISDIQFANNAGIKAILIGKKHTPAEIASLNIHAQYPDLLTFAKQINL